MNLKMALTGMCTAALFMTANVYATEPVSSETQTSTAPVSQYSTETTTESTAPVWTMPAATTTTYTEPDEPTSEPALIKLEVGDIKDKKFSVKLNIKSQAPVSSASISVEFDQELLELESTKQNDKAGGMAVENTFEGKYVYNYVNADGSQYQGGFVTLNFKILDDDMTSTVLYLSVTSLDNDRLRPISFTTENGIVTYKTATEIEAAAKAAAKTINLHLNEQPISIESLGITDVKECTVENTQILIYEDKKLKTLASGETMIEIIHSNDKKEYFKAVIEAPITESQIESTVNSEAAESVIAEKNEKSDFSLKNLIIIIVVIAGATALVIEYFVIMRPLDKTSVKNTENDDNDDETEDNDSSDNTDSIDIIGEDVTENDNLQAEETENNDEDNIN